jgi:transposase, IS5 family
VEADVRYPTDSGLALDSARVPAGEARKLLAKVDNDAGHVRDRSRAIGKRVRAMTRTLGRRTGERKQQVLELTEQAGELVKRSIREAKRLIVAARRRARGRGAKAKLRQINKLTTFIVRAELVTEQIRKRMRGERISDRLVSIFDADARPIRKGKLGRPNEFGFVAQICEVTENTKPGARGLIIPAATGQLGNPTEDTLLPDTAAELEQLGISPRGGRPRRRLQRRAHPPVARALPAGADLHRGPPTARVPADTATACALPHRHRGPDQSPQARLRATPHPPKGPPRDANLDQMIDPHLQP